MTCDKEQWRSIFSTVSVEDLIRSYKNPSIFQRELTELIESIKAKEDSRSVLEVGSSFGVTTALLPPSYKKVILDYDEQALKTGRALFEQLGQTVDTIVLDMFDLDTSVGEYDIVFNSGVLEHFNKSERKRIIENMAAVTKEYGYIIIGVPNHSSIPYRIGYLFQLFTGKWLYPREEKIVNLSDETDTIASIIPRNIVILDKSNIYHYLPRILKNIFKKLDYLFNFEGYLKVFIFQKISPKVDE